MANVTKHIKCPKCGKIAIEVSRLKFGREFMVKLLCGHQLYTKQLDRFTGEDSLESFLTHDKPFEFQKVTLDFVNQSGGRCGIFHEQGLGKTVCAALALRTHKDMMLPALVICKSNLAVQWFKQLMNWVDENLPVQIIESAKDFIIPNAQVYVVSYDLLRRIPDDKMELFDTCKTIIIDECQHIKNSQSQRANNVRRICKDKPYVIALSGTPIKNHSGEYFTILNLLKPERFPSIAYYEGTYVDTYWNGFKFVKGGLKNEKLFRQNTEDFIIRFEQAEVMPDLPELIRDFQYYDIDKDLRKAYDAAESDLMDYVESEGDSGSFETYQHILAYLNKMRQITAVAKVEVTADMVRDILMNTEKKVIIFLHHHIARSVLLANLEKLTQELNLNAPLAITESTSNDKKETIKRDFKNNPLSRVLVLGTLASGEGMDGLQESCDTLIMMERQWNPANEEQAEKRLQRIGQKFITRALYPIAIGTVDEMFTELIEKKRQQIKQTMGDSDVIQWQESNTIRDLIGAIATKRGGKKWQMAH